MKRNRVLVVLLFSICAPLARAANWPEHPTLRAVRATAPVTIDGDLSDAAWAAAPEFTDFTQHDPVDGARPTLPTSLRVVYDDHAIYFGAKMTDTAPPTGLLARRDTFVESDFLSINLDPQHDRLSGNAFTINPANVQIDTILYNDISEDPSWDGVWESATRVVADGWIAEVRIPFSQLRFPDKAQHVWGINVTRRTLRNNEWVRIVNTRKGDNGFVSHFADLTGLDGIHRSRPLEVVPYAVVRSDVLTRADRANPLLDRRDHRLDGGLDLKYALTSTLTLTGTINPDFGQVEVDPAEVNLSAFETFYSEKRPFFTEGLNIFAFGDSPANSRFNFMFSPELLYSRRIGRSPQAGIDAQYVASPSETTILGAAKLTGKVGKWSIGILDALTDAERARFVDGESRGRQQVEPMTNYFATRMTKEIGGSSRVGFLVSSVNRRLPEELTALRRDALTTGVDGYTLFANRNWLFDWAGAGTRVAGSERAIALTQTAPGHYYQRPDAGHVSYDPSRTSLSGWSGRAMVAKQKGKWRPNVMVQAYSPGFEVNDAGFMQRADMISSSAMMLYVNEETTRYFRGRKGWGGVWTNRNFDGNTLERGVVINLSGTLQNYWEYEAQALRYGEAVSDTATRGGPLVRTRPGLNTKLSFNSDTRKRFSFEVGAASDENDDGSYERSAEIELNYRPSTNLRLSIEPEITRAHDSNQYLFTVADAAATQTYGHRYVFSDLEQHSFELGTRVDWTLNSRLSFQLYAQPFLASGDYHNPHALVAASTADYEPYAAPDDRDFNFRSVRGSAVVRWEFRPGSALYVVWNENRADVAPVGDFRFRRDLRAISTAPSHDVFLVKISYWLPM